MMFIRIEIDEISRKKIFSPNHFMPYRNQKYHLCKLLSPYYPESFFTIINVIKLLLYPFFLKMMFIRIEIDDISRKKFFSPNHFMPCRNQK